MKSKTTYICRECGYKSPKWLGKCPSCNSWNTMDETLVTPEKKTSAVASLVRERFGAYAEKDFRGDGKQ